MSDVTMARGDVSREQVAGALRQALGPATPRRRQERRSCRSA
jgi:hypothetical protein